MMKRLIAVLIMFNVVSMYGGGLIQGVANIAETAVEGAANVTEAAVEGTANVTGAVVAAPGEIISGQPVRRVYYRQPVVVQPVVEEVVEE